MRLEEPKVKSLEVSALLHFAGSGVPRFARVAWERRMLLLLALIASVLGFVGTASLAVVVAPLAFATFIVSFVV